MVVAGRRGFISWLGVEKEAESGPGRVSISIREEAEGEDGLS